MPGEADNVQTENVIGGSGDDKLTGDSQNNILTGGPGADVLIGRDGDDTYRPRTVLPTRRWTAMAARTPERRQRPDRLPRPGPLGCE